MSVLHSYIVTRVGVPVLHRVDRTDLHRWVSSLIFEPLTEDRRPLMILTDKNLQYLQECILEGGLLGILIESEEEDPEADGYGFLDDPFILTEADVERDMVAVGALIEMARRGTELFYRFKVEN